VQFRPFFRGVEDRSDALGGLPGPTMNARRFNRLFRIGRRLLDHRKLHIPQFAIEVGAAPTHLWASFMRYDPSG
jgi:hypothetical protein